MRSARQNGGLQIEATRRFCVATLRPRGCTPCAAYPAHPLNRYTRLRGYIGSAGLKTKTDTLTAHRERPGGETAAVLHGPPQSERPLHPGGQAAPYQVANGIWQAATGVPSGIRQIHAHPRRPEEAVPGEICGGHRSEAAGTDADQAPGQRYGAVRDFSFPAASGKMKSVLTGRQLWDKVSHRRAEEKVEGTKWETML